MNLKLKQDATFIPVDAYGSPCPDAYAVDTKTTIDRENKIYTLEYAIYRNKSEAQGSKTPLKRLAYQFKQQEVPAKYSEDSVQLVPKFDAFDDVFESISLDIKVKTAFADKWDAWILSNLDAYGNMWSENWENDI